MSKEINENAAVEQAFCSLHEYEATEPLLWKNSLGDFCLLNGQAGDSALYAHLKNMPNRLLFDAGETFRLSFGDRLTVTNIFISHAHFDHIIGFDGILRASIMQKVPVTVCGPTGIAEILQHRIKGFLWNIAKPDAVNYTIREIAWDGTVRSFHISKANGFELVPVENEKPYCDGLNPLHETPGLAFAANLPDGHRVWGMALHHAYNKPDYRAAESISYFLESPKKLHFCAERLGPMGMRPGPWVGAFQKAYLNGQLEETFTLADGQTLTVTELAEKLLETKEGERFCYMTDLSLNAVNTPRVLAFLDAVGEANDMLIESNFSQEERDIAWKKGHLTTRQSALLAAYAQSKTYRNFHLSDKYVSGAQWLIDEAASLFEELRTLDRETLREMILADSQPKEELVYQNRDV